MLLVLISPVLVACGDDDDVPSKADGVNVYGGKKLIQMDLWPEDSNIPNSFKIEYDSKGRLSKILNKGKASGYYSNASDEYKAIVTIDYDIRLITFSENGYYDQTVGFSLNNNGYIELIGTTPLSYDSNGFLNEVEDAHGITTLAYNNNELIKAAFNPISKGNLKLYYLTYGSKNDSGDLYIYAKQDSEKKGYIKYNNRAIGLFIAYQAGLFGRVTKTFLNLKDKNEASSFLDFEDSYKRYSYKITFVCQ